MKKINKIDNGPRIRQYCELHINGEKKYNISIVIIRVKYWKSFCVSDIVKNSLIDLELMFS